MLLTLLLERTTHTHKHTDTNTNKFKTKKKRVQNGKKEIETNLVFTKVRNERTCQFVNVTNWKRLSQLQTSWSFTLVNFLLPTYLPSLRIYVATPHSSANLLYLTPPIV